MTCSPLQRAAVLVGVVCIHTFFIITSTPPKHHQKNQQKNRYHGLCELHANLNSNELGIFFRNNHFNVIYKHGATNALYLLVTDQGFLETSAMWETLTNVDGDSSFLDGNFKPLHGGGGGGGRTGLGMAVGTAQGEMSPNSQEVQDIARAEALSMQEASWTAVANPPSAAAASMGGGSGFGSAAGGGAAPQTDAELARRLQAEEQARAHAHVPQQQQQEMQARPRATQQQPVPRSDAEFAALLQLEEQARFNQQQQQQQPRARANGDVVASRVHGGQKKSSNCIIC